MCEFTSSSANEDRDERNDERFQKYFDDLTEWHLEYVQSDDYCGEYSYLMNESDRIDRSVAKLLRDAGVADLDAVEVAATILDGGDFEWNVCDEYSSESVGYLDSFQIGEFEDQVDVDRIREDIGDDIEGDFLDALEAWMESQNDFCLRHWGSKSLRDQKYPTVYLITYTALRIDYVIDEETLADVVATMREDKCDV